MAVEQDKGGLQSFLLERRGRLKPADFELSAFARRRVPGLRREEVAELAGVSTKWYALFESGANRRFSPQFLLRVADALRLSEEERAVMYYLALPEIASTVLRLTRERGGMGWQTGPELERFAKKARAATSWTEAVTLGVKTLHEIVRPNCVASASLRDPSGMARGYAIGSRERYWTALQDELILEKHAPLQCGGVGVGEYIPLVEQVAGLALVIVPLVKKRPKEAAYDYRCEVERWVEFNGSLRERSCLATPLFEKGVFRGILSAGWTEPRAFRPAEIDVLEKIAAIVDSSAS